MCCSKAHAVQNTFRNSGAVMKQICQTRIAKGQVMSRDHPLAGAKVVGRLRPPPSSGSAIVSRRAWTEIGCSLNLSGRELQIVRGVFDDRTEVAIAADLGISPHTVHTHVERLHHKLAVANRVELVLRVMDEFLVLTASSQNLLPSICGRRAAGRCPFRS
jgi:DNA-binding CsgD family transcriptional regulator